MPAAAGPLHVRLLDSSFRVVGPAHVLDGLARVLPGAGGSTAERLVEVSGLSVFVTLGEHRTAASEAELLPEVVACLNAAALQDCRDLAVHAGVVAAGGEVLALPGAAGAGKSTLTTACLQAGLDYVSDEALVLDPVGRVRPYPKPVALDPGSLALLGLPAPQGAEGLVTAADVGGVVAPEPLRLAHVVQPQRRPGPPVLAEVPRAESAALLLRMSFNHYRDPQHALRLTASVVAGARTWRLGYDAPADGAAVLRDLLSG